MRTTVTLDDELVRKATKYSGIKSNSELINFTLKSFIQREAGRRLAEMGGSDPDMKYPDRGPRMGREPLEAPPESPQDGDEV